MSPKIKPSIIIVSDGRGHTASEIVRAALVQFSDTDYDLTLRGQVRTVEEINEIVDAASRRPSILFYTLVSPQARAAIDERARQQFLPAVDLLGPVFAGLHDLLRTPPGSTPGLLYETSKPHFDRMEAIDFTLQHDDGARPWDLDGADVVLVGVSRASKSSTCFFLAYRGIKAANVPLFHNIPLPKELLEVDPRKVIGLSINPFHLQSVREIRATTMGLAASDPYLDRRQIAKEIRAANEVMASNGWRCINVSYKAIEEIAMEVVRLRKL